MLLRGAVVEGARYLRVRPHRLEQPVEFDMPVASLDGRQERSRAPSRRKIVDLESSGDGRFAAFRFVERLHEGPVCDQHIGRRRRFAGNREFSLGSGYFCVNRRRPVRLARRVQGLGPI